MADDVVVEREIAADPDRVWSLVTDVARMGQWSPENTGGVWLGEATGPEVGARFRGRNRRGVRRWSTTCTVTASEPGRLFRFDVAYGPLAVATWSYELEPAGDGCVVRERFVDRRGRLISVLGTIASGVGNRAEHNRAGMEQTLDRLAAAAEAPSAT